MADTGLLPVDMGYGEEVDLIGYNRCGRWLLAYLLPGYRHLVFKRELKRLRSHLQFVHSKVA